MLREHEGFTPLESITAATLNGARVIGVDHRTGTARVGMEADLVAVDGDPLADTRVFFEPRLVVSDGRIVVEGAGLQSSPASATVSAVADPAADPASSETP
jgi:imidazolonepropionase-like amidohydrolase